LVGVGVGVAVAGTVVLVGVGVAGTEVLVGVAVAVETVGLLAGSPGKVSALISWRFVKPSPSESRFSMAARAAGPLPALK